ncbi:hypothetical protein Thi970DRAFT_01090 [Thiorhodovibrio frisius]|uniref:Uncharacterized protein n=1 Tax=Thiorhodovibrio frisius TaxID=631362 RepID=H8YY99_9GAMM|nr:hypothetical protein Thi970DRAFT_01090 [Thiorhodovibrio frisius]WPL23493.1 hypothetical protein Thiofri_03681 [Thiorhodovibrio frisius]
MGGMGSYKKTTPTYVIFVTQAIRIFTLGTYGVWVQILRADGDTSAKNILPAKVGL